MDFFKKGVGKFVNVVDSMAASKVFKIPSTGYVATVSKQTVEIKDSKGNVLDNVIEGKFAVYHELNPTMPLHGGEGIKSTVDEIISHKNHITSVTMESRESGNLIVIVFHSEYGEFYAMYILKFRPSNGNAENHAGSGAPQAESTK